jgi:hypothetical protein
MEPEPEPEPQNFAFLEPQIRNGIKMMRSFNTGFSI